MKKLFVIVICLALLFPILTLLVGCTKQQARAVATWGNDISQEFKVQNANNRLYNYQWFYDQYNACQATANNVKMLTGEERTGTLMVLNNMISEYNSRASQTINAALWKGSDLPRSLTIKDFGIN